MQTQLLNINNKTLVNMLIKVAPCDSQDSIPADFNNMTKDDNICPPMAIIEIKIIFTVSNNRKNEFGHADHKTSNSLIKIHLELLQAVMCRCADGTITIDSIDN